MRPSSLRPAKHRIWFQPRTWPRSSKTKTFLGASGNADKTRIRMALIILLIQKRLRMRCALVWSLSNLVARL
jgi:hypothetical protein